MSIYVEIVIRSSMEDLWRRTQDPKCHESWDLRFSEIDYLPRPDETEPQRFRYATRIGLGLRVEGDGESQGTKDSSGARSSALKFWSDDPKSLIREGSGYWKYVPTREGIRFFTWYDYRTRFGGPGRIFDAWVFRPLLGWATSWSFDRLRLWIEKDIHPSVTLERAMLHAVARVTLAVIFVYHGLVPKIIASSPDEFALLQEGGVPPGQVATAVVALGLGEIGWGLLLSLRWMWRWPFAATVMGMAMALGGVAFYSPRFLVAAFNPVSLNVAVVALSVIGWLSSRELPSARRCLRERKGDPA